MHDISLSSDRPSRRHFGAVLAREVCLNTVQHWDASISGQRTQKPRELHSTKISCACAVHAAAVDFPQRLASRHPWTHPFDYQSFAINIIIYESFILAQINGEIVVFSVQRALAAGGSHYKQCEDVRSPHPCDVIVCDFRFPKEKELRRQWEVAARKKGFSATKSSVLCSEHFKPHDIDATGQTVRIREGAKPSVFNFEYRLQKHVFTRTTKTSKKAQERLKVELECSGNLQQAKPPSLHPPRVDHCYALPASPADVKARLTEALARVESLEHELRNVKDRQRRSKNTVFCLLEHMRGKNPINVDLKEKLHS
ncbi:THAP domain-containing protein 2-like [Nerophis ophidion]|uniref:THAP domain-containing protein 2-like n=1 Tax=Nerophis ophidion TaxID=159077 RepID=UPI002ADF0F93|nr:THAP domain-containing protein 2-like [Nerophis ophidion]